MNKQRRKALDEVHSKLMTIVEELEDIEAEEEDAYYNLPEGIQNSEKGEKMQEYVEIISSTRYQIDEMLGYIWDIIAPLYEKR